MKGSTVITRNTLIWAALAAGLIGLVVLLWSLRQPDVKVEVLTFAMPYDRNAAPPAAGFVWAGVEAEVCSNVSADDGVAVGNENWMLELPDGTQIPAGPRGVPGSTAPASGMIYMLSHEKCLVDWFTFAVPEGEQPDAVIFSGAGETKRISWP